MNHVKTISDHSAPIQCVKVSRQYDLVASSSLDLTVKVYKLSTFELLQTLTFATTPRSFDFSDSKLFVSNYDASVSIYNFDQEVNEFILVNKLENLTEKEIKSISANRTQFAICSRDRSVSIWNIDEVCIFHSKIHNQDVKSIDFDGQNLVSTSYDNSIVFYQKIDGDFEVTNAINSTVQGDSIGPLDFVQNNTIFCAKLLRNQRAISAGGDGCIRLYNNQQQVACYQLSQCALYSIGVSGDLVAICGEEGKLFVVQITENINFQYEMLLNKGELNCVEVSDDMIFVGGDDGCVRVFQCQ
ncbi:Iron-sulfur cluster assembly protein CIA1 [Spironucleus salmonicida]|uniref:Cytosolic iron-sulfur protein assembly protein n=1 Tax=Spironucleus salmonicida TaxID=348837 RepID=V6LAA9_9EUKA|nr:Iron-sulfur cluster assembly protein CIA1 [Spironucleus salmonicida]|eukprot:EST41375.1 Cytosolic iron-sulfur protein assembly protein [Spironucleus salmonicida]